MLVQLLYFPGCPNVSAAREALRQALMKVDPAPHLAELDVTAAHTPTHLRSWGSPTILVNGADVAGDDAAGSCCRLYPGSGTRGAPSPAMIEAALRRAQGRSST
jgi:hypothetical protein